MRWTRRIFAVLLALALTLGLSGGALAAGEEDKAGEITLGIYTTAGLGGIWWDRDPLTGEETPLNHLRAAAAMERAAERNNAELLLDLGNGLGEVCDLLELGVAPLAAALRLGTQIYVPGAWERSLGAEDRKQMEAILTAPEQPGRQVKLLDGEGEKPWLICPVRFGDAEDQLRVGILSLERAEACEAALREEESCDLLIAVAPSGTWSGAALAQMAAKTEIVDLILVGSGTEEPPVQVKNSKGEDVPVSGGKGVAGIELTLGETGLLRVGQRERLSLEGEALTQAETALKGEMKPYYRQAEALAQQELATLAGDWDREEDPFLGQSDTVTLLQEARLWISGAELSLLPWGAVKREAVGELSGGSYTLRDSYRLYSPEETGLRVVELTGLQLKNWLERCASRLRVGEDGSWTGDAGVDQLYGLSYALYLGNPEGSRVMSMTCRGEPVTANQTFRVVVDASRLTSPEEDIYGWYETTGIDAQSNKLWREESGEVWSLEISPARLAAEYVKSLTTQWRQLTPPRARSRWSITAATSQESLAPVTRLEFVSALNRAAGSPVAKRREAYFRDVPQTYPALLTPSVLDWAVEAGVVQGNGGGLFLPNEPISREQAAVMLLRFDIARGKGPEGSWATAVPYTDAANVASWASEALMWNVLRDYLSPDDGGYFHPWAAVTAAELEGLLEKLEQR